MGPARSQLTRLQYANQHLHRGDDDVLACVTAVLGIYSTAPTSHLGVIARVEDARPYDLERLVAERSLVRMAGVRGSGFLVPTELVPILAGATRDRRERVFKQVTKAFLDAKTYESMAAKIEKLLRGTEMTAAQIRTAVAPKDPRVADGVKHALALMTDGYRLVATGVNGTWRSNLTRYALWEEWLPDVDPLAMDPADARPELARRYFEAHGPATAEDFQWWSGFKKDVVQVIEEAEVPRLEGEYFGTLRPASPARGVRLVPYWDLAMLTHRRRDHVIAPDHYDRVYDASGNPAPTILVDGIARGIWDLTVERTRLVVRAAPFAGFSAATRTLIAREADRLGTAVGVADVEVEFARSAPSVRAGPWNMFMAPLRPR